MTGTTDNFDAYQPNGEPAADRWVTALRLFDAPADDSAGPDVAEAWERGRALFEAGDYRGAVKHLGTVVEQEPGQVAPRLLLARAYYHSAQLRGAEEQLRAVIDLDPVEHYAYLMLGRTLERGGRHTEAGSWLRAAAAFDATAAG
jgi:tetratricopeptide (TPR) repeat protein